MSATKIFFYIFQVFRNISRNCHVFYENTNENILIYVFAGLTKYFSSIACHIDHNIFKLFCTLLEHTPKAKGQQ